MFYTKGMTMMFHKWLQAELRDKGMSQADLVRETKAGSGLVSLWYWGKKTPSTRYIPKIAAALGKTEQQVFSAIEERDTSPVANVDVQTRAAITRLFGLPPDFSQEEAELVRDLVGVFRRWQERMLEREGVRAASARGPRQLRIEDDPETSEGSR